ncbi:MAG: glycosyltransferase [Alphaproteobacteria bacterium]|nr:glycosyltransferase [Alphaproteobacteria bacterium]
MSRAPRILFWVQHLLGMGHLHRAARLARALAEAGLEVTLASGGPEVPGLRLGNARLEQLPPLRASDRSFRELLHPDGHPIDEAYKNDRREKLLALYRTLRPDAVMTELYPFGRRQMRFELEPLMESVSADGAMGIASIRDILVTPDKASRADEALERANRWFEMILVHGDPNLIPLDRTFPRIAELTCALHYTGYAVEPAPPAQGPGHPGHDEVLVSAGGGAVSVDLVRAAMAARPLTDLAELRWRVLIGPVLPEAQFQQLCAEADPGVIVERARGDFTQLLSNCRLSISQGGYNTVMEVLAAGTPAVCVPYAGGYETEQTLRCQLLAERGAFQVVDEAQLSPERLAEAIARAAGQKPAAVAIDTTGLAKTAALVAGALQPAELKERRNAPEETE